LGKKIAFMNLATLLFTFSEEILPFCFRGKNTQFRNAKRKIKTSKGGYLVSINLKKGHIV